MIIVLVIIGLSLIILVHEAGHFWAAKAAGIRVHEFGFGFPPRLWGRQVGDTLISVNALPFGGFVRLEGEDGSDAPSPGSFAGASFPRKALALAAGVLMNVVFGWVLLSLVFSIGTPAHLLIAEVSPGSPAAAAGLRAGEAVLRASAAGSELRDPIPSSDLVALTKAAGDLPISLDVMKGSETRTVTLTGRANPPEGQGALGIALEDVGIAAMPVPQALLEAARATGETVAAVATGFWYLVTRVFTAPEVLQSVSGPVGIVGMAVDTGSLGVVYILQIMALISLNLAVLNLIPFPALDGGRLLILLFERLFKRSLSRRLQVWVNTAGFAALILLMVVVTIQDIGRL